MGAAVGAKSVQSRARKPSATLSEEARQAGAIAATTPISTAIIAATSGVWGETRKMGKIEPKR